MTSPVEHYSQFEAELPAYEQQMLAIHRELESGLPLQIRINDVARRLRWSENADAVDVLSGLRIDACQRLAGADSRYEVDGMAVAQMYQDGALTGLYVAQETYSGIFDVEDVLRYVPLACRNGDNGSSIDEASIAGALDEGIKWLRSCSPAVQTMVDQWHQLFDRNGIHGDMFVAGFSTMQASSDKMAVAVDGLHSLQPADGFCNIPWDDLLE